ncbi:MAG TPA: hypothetical protein VMM36_12015 [Opitutaceae bacterium]|nr:hypothetical protein [Opitutaceae bacterium]
MKTSILLIAAAATVAAQTAEPSGAALTIYNQGFGVVRETIPLDLTRGVNSVRFSGATVHLEPDSVILRDPTGLVNLNVLEQSFRADTINQGLLLYLSEGKVIDFRTWQDGKETIVRGKVIRSGYVPNTAAMNRYGNQFAQRQYNLGNHNTGSGQPIIEVGGLLRFSLPGEPLFPSLTNDAILYPTLTWQLRSDRDAKLDAELSYVTGGMAWEAAYNLVSPEKGDTISLVGWVTLDNQSGRTFEDAAVKLMAGDVSKLQPDGNDVGYAKAARAEMDSMRQDGVTEKAFDEFHLYTLPRAVTLRNREMKQVEFLRAEGVQSRVLYIYNGAAIDRRRYRGWNAESVRNDRDYGTVSNPKIWVMREFENTKANGLGVPLPKGRTRFYRSDEADGRPEFTGENTIDHTPEGETVRIYTGDAFDIVGERKRTDYVLNSSGSSMEEAFEIRLRNRKKEAVEVRVAERMYRWLNWSIVEQSDPFVKTAAQDGEFRIALEAGEERVITYRVRYDWK